jgi:hypothetical protein
MARALLLCLYLTPVFAAIDETRFSPSQILTRDVAIIGGGASGTYAAVRLHSDLDISVIVIEPKNRLGGHVDTYTVPETNTTLEFGVQSYMRYGPAEDFYARFGIEIIPFSSRRLTSIPVNIETGERLSGYTPPSNNATTEALRTWLQFVEQYEAFFEPGYWNFPAPEDIPAELLIPFGEFAKTHNVAAAVPRMAAISGMGAGGIEQMLTIDVVQAFGAELTRELLDGRLFVPVGSNSLLYQRARELLGEDVLLESSIVETERSDAGVKLVVKTKGGEVLVKAKQALWTPYPSHDKNLKTFDEDAKEVEVFRDWEASWESVSVLKIPCIPENYSIDYLAPTAVPADWLSIRDYPYTLRLDSTGPSGLNLFRALFSANYSLTPDEMRSTILDGVQRLVTAGTLNHTGSCEVEYRAFSEHSGVMWPTQTPEALENGFVQKLFALQGYRSTWWTGRSWTGYYTSSVWAFTETVLQRMIQELRKE